MARNGPRTSPGCVPLWSSWVGALFAGFQRPQATENGRAAHLDFGMTPAVVGIPGNQVVTRARVS
jgi:hypothetical protein